MAGNNEFIDPTGIRNLANDLESKNKSLKNELINGLDAVRKLKNIWESPAATETLNNFEAFANEFSENYEKVIQQYVVYLRDIVHTDFTGAETKNVEIGSAFK